MRRGIGGGFASAVAASILVAAPARADGPPVDPAPAGEVASTEPKAYDRGHEWFYVNADAGFSYINMTAINASTLSVQNSTAAGPSFGAAAGIRIFFLTLGARANLNQLSSFSLWQLDAELGFHIPLGHWEPYLGFHGGYCFVGSFDDGISDAPNLSITGADAGLQLGVDYYFNHFVSVGLDVSGNALFLHRAPAVALPASAVAELPPGDAAAYQQSGDSIGFGISPSLHLGLHL